MIAIINPSKCSGCTACVSVCSHIAITMKPDTLGFLYPVVDVSKCVDCGLCEKVCSFHENYDKSLNLPKPIAFGVRHKNLNEIKTSRSGAAFIALSDEILDRGGVIYGAGFYEHFRIAHKRAVTKEDRNEFKGSKYVQSDLNSVFLQVMQDLKTGLIVLFSGTPCQTAGLNSYVGKRFRENLYLVDIICHGVSSPRVWDDYLTWLESKEDSSIIKLNFRNKSLFGWNAHKETYLFEDGHERWYKYRFYNEILIRKCCNECPYSNTIRPSDLTLGDFWGYEKIIPEMFVDNQGCSMLYCNTGKGYKLFENVKKNLTYLEVPVSKTIQPNLISPTRIHRSRNSFEQHYDKIGIEKALKKYGLIGYRYYIDKLITIIQKKLS